MLTTTANLINIYKENIVRECRADYTIFYFLTQFLNQTGENLFYNSHEIIHYYPFMYAVE